MIPIRDANPSHRTPVVTWSLIAICVVAWVVYTPKDPIAAQEFYYRQAAISCELVTAEPLSFDEVASERCTEGQAPIFPDKNLPLSVIVSIFLHGGFIHLVTNMWVLFIFGNNVEDAFGRPAFLLFYLLAGVAATLGHVLVTPASTIPVVGASGAIAGVMGAYLILFPAARVVSVFPVLFFLPFPLPAVIFLGIWFLGQFALAGEGSNIAWQAHVAGFIFGVATALVLRAALLRRLARLRGLPRV